MRLGEVMKSRLTRRKTREEGGTQRRAFDLEEDDVGGADGLWSDGAVINAEKRREDEVAEEEQMNTEEDEGRVRYTEKSF